MLARTGISVPSSPFPTRNIRVESRIEEIERSLLVKAAGLSAKPPYRARLWRSQSDTSFPSARRRGVARCASNVARGGSSRTSLFRKHPPRSIACAIARPPPSGGEGSAREDELDRDEAA